MTIFDRRRYQEALAALPEGQTSLVRGELVFGLARDHKLTASPPEPLTSEEVIGGLQGAMFTVPFEAEELLERLRQVLPSLRRLSPDWNRPDDRFLFSVVTASVSRLLGHLPGDVALDIADVLETWIRTHPSRRTTSQADDWLATAKNPYEAGPAEAAKLIAQLRGGV
jgi:hypothetical protein